VVHLTISQLMYTSASYIAMGINGQENGLKALAGLFSICVLPAVYLSILKMQSLLSNPFGRFSVHAMDFPVAQLKNYLDGMLDNIRACTSEDSFRAVGAGVQSLLDDKYARQNVAGPP